MKFLGLITARGGSKGIPGKNVKPLAGKPLIAWTIEAAAASGRLERVIVSTDDDEIADVARQCGLAVPFKRPAELARDDSSHFSVVEHAIKWMAENADCRPEYLVLLQPTSPFRTAADIDAAIELAEKKNADAVVGVCEAAAHPMLVKKMDDSGAMADFVPADIAYKRRQSLPPAYQINGAIYVNRVVALLRDRDFCPPGAIGYVMSAEHSMEIDDMWDFHMAELVARHPFDHKEH